MISNAAKSRAAILLAVAITSLAVSSGRAASFQDIDALGGLLLSGTSVGGTFSIADGSTGTATIGSPYGVPTTYGDVANWNGSDSIANAWVYLYVRNASNGGVDYASINLGSDIFTRSTTKSFSVIGGMIDVTTLNNNGTLSYTITGNGVYVDFAALVATTDPNATGGLVSMASVPDGGSTLLLAGSALLGLAGLKRKLGR